jgi:uncharacterized protein with HEPN domain
MNKQPDVYLELALRALERVPRFLAERTLKIYLNDEFCQAAVGRQLEVAGERLVRFENSVRSCSIEFPRVL